MVFARSLGVNKRAAGIACGMATSSGAAEKPSLRKIYKRQRAYDKAHQSRNSKVMGWLFPILLVVGVSLNGKAGKTFLWAGFAVAVILFATLFVLMRRRHKAGAGSSDTV